MLRVELKDPDHAGGVLLDGITDNWQRFEIPLSRFKEVVDWSQLKEFVVVLGPDYVTRTRGAFFLDDVYLAENPNEKLRSAQRR